MLGVSAMLLFRTGIMSTYQKVVFLHVFCKRPFYVKFMGIGWLGVSLEQIHSINLCLNMTVNMHTHEAKEREENQQQQNKNVPQQYRTNMLITNLKNQHLTEYWYSASHAEVYSISTQLCMVNKTNAVHVLSLNNKKTQQWWLQTKQ